MRTFHEGLIGVRVNPFRWHWLSEHSEDGGVGLGSDMVSCLKDYRGSSMTAEVMSTVTYYRNLLD